MNYGNFSWLTIPGSLILLGSAVGRVDVIFLTFIFSPFGWPLVQASPFIYLKVFDLYYQSNELDLQSNAGGLSFFPFLLDSLIRQRPESSLD